jgi:hypothetical protein
MNKDRVFTPTLTLPHQRGRRSKEALSQRREKICSFYQLVLEINQEHLTDRFVRH